MLVVKNSLHFLLTITSYIIQDNQITVSFDVEWLFTSVHVEDAVQALLKMLESDRVTKQF